jgi:hypothetical protein
MLSLNQPPHLPGCSGGMEKGTRNFNAALAGRLMKSSLPSELSLTAKVAVHELNHRPQHCFKGHTAGAKPFSGLY